MRLSCLIAWIKLGRYLFLGGGFVFFALGAAIAHYQGVEVDASRYIVGQLIVTSTQLMVQYSNDYFDFQADVANQTPTRWSGGSRVLPSGQLSPQIALYTAAGLGCIAIIVTIFGVIDRLINEVSLGLLIAAFVLSWNYSGPPLRLHSRGLGEIAVALVVPVLTPLVGYSIQAETIDSMLFLAVLPLALLQFNMVLGVHFPDMEGDAAVGKRTLVVVLGRKRTAQLYQGVLVAAYFLIPILILAGLPLEVGLAMILPIPLAIWLFWRLKNGQGEMAEHWDNLAFWTIGLLMGTGVLTTVAFIFGT